MNHDIELMKPELVQQGLGIKHHVVVFGSARTLPGTQDYEQARALGALVARWSRMTNEEDPLHIATGGGPGIMEAANRGSHDEGWPTVGLLITLPFESQINVYVTPELAFRFHYFAMRKAHLVLRAAALVTFPGGFGTLDEAFEILTLTNSGKLDPMPAIFVGVDFWSRLIDWEYLVESGMVSHEALDFVQIVDDAESAWRIICEFYGLDDERVA